MASEQEIASAERLAAEGGSGDAGCPAEMGFFGEGPACRRKLHPAPIGIDEQPVCLMHSKDPAKLSGPLHDEFWRVFEEILAKAGEGKADFKRFVFPEVRLRKRDFEAICIFFDAVFMQNVDFIGATFDLPADFRGATFEQEAEFSGAVFMQFVNFIGTTFEQTTCFRGVIFMHEVNFTSAIFSEKVDFTRAEFSATADYDLTEFHGTGDWTEAHFIDRAEFRGTTLQPKDPTAPSSVFSLAKFAKPAEIVFDDVDLSRSLFHNCDVSQLWFTSSVWWGTRKGNRGLAVFEETIDLKQEFAEGLRRDGQRDYRAIAQIYQQLKKNYDSRLDYWTANEFHFGEMEMKRLAGPASGRLLTLRRWWHRNLSFVAWYKYASDYGNSYGKPLVWLFVILLAATLLFPLPGVGLKQAISANSARVTYSRVWNQQDSWTNNFWTEAKLIGKSGITAIDMATFQRTPEYAPAYPWGRVLAIFETLLTSSLFALFLLATRRQFRR
jgi:uncharacterized protein YjbI with pentapeptide repeats